MSFDLSRGRIVWRVVAGAAVLVAALGAARAGEPTDPARAEDPFEVETLTGLVGELVDLQRETAEEKASWREEKAHLEATARALERERTDLDARLEKARARADESRSERERLAARAAEAQAVLEEVGRSARMAGERLLRVHEGLPEPLAAMTEAGAVRLREALDGEADAVERLGLVAAFATDLHRLQGSAHVVSALVAIDGAELEVRAVLAGCAAGWFVSADGSAAGALVFEKGKWKAQRDDSLAEPVREAIRVHSKERPPSLVLLPVPAPRSGELGEGEQ